MRMVMPRAAIARMTGKMSRDFGRIQAGKHLVEQQKSRLGGERAREFEPLARRQPSGSRPARRAVAPRPTRRATSPAAASAARARGMRADGRRRRYCRARVSPANGCRIWKVRAMPSAARLCGGAPVMSAPIEDDAARARRAAKPGDQIEQRRLAGAVRADQAGDAPRHDIEETPSTASRPPKRLETLFDDEAAARAHGAAPPSGRRPQHAADQQTRDAARRERDRRGSAARRNSARSTPGMRPATASRELRRAKCSASAPSSGPNTVPRPPTIGASSASIEIHGPKAMVASTNRKYCA